MAGLRTLRGLAAGRSRAAPAARALLALRLAISRRPLCREFFESGDNLEYDCIEPWGIPLIRSREENVTAFVLDQMYETMMQCSCDSALVRLRLPEPEDARRLGVAPASDQQAVGLADDEQVKKALVALCQAAWFWGRPVVLAFDQVDNLEPAQFRALARFLHALLDAATNLLVVTSGVQATLVQWRQERVVQDSSWDRLAQTQAGVMTA